MINDFKIHALEKIEHIENQANSTFNECDTILKALNDVKTKLIRLKNSEESLKKKIIWKGSFKSRSLSHWNLINTEVKILDIKEFKSKQLLSSNPQPSDTQAIPDVD